MLFIRPRSPNINSRVLLHRIITKIKDIIGSSQEFYQNFEQAKFQVKVTYKGAFGKSYQNEFHLDLDILRRRIYTKEFTATEVVEELIKINENLKSLCW